MVSRGYISRWWSTGMVAGTAGSSHPDLQVGGQMGNWKWLESLQDSKPTPVTYLFQQGRTSRCFSSSSIRRVQVVKHTSLWGHLYSNHHNNTTISISYKMRLPRLCMVIFGWCYAYYNPHYSKKAAHRYIINIYL